MGQQELKDFSKQRMEALHEAFDNLKLTLHVQTPMVTIEATMKTLLEHSLKWQEANSFNQKINEHLG